MRQACLSEKWKKNLFSALPLKGKESCSPAACLHLYEEERLLLPPDHSHWLVRGGSTTSYCTCPVIPETVSVFSFGFELIALKLHYCISYTWSISWLISHTSCLDVIWSFMCTPSMWWLLMSWCFSFNSVARAEIPQHMQDLAFTILLWLQRKFIHGSIFGGFLVKQNISSFSLPFRLMSHSFVLFSDILDTLLYKKSEGCVAK